MCNVVKLTRAEIERRTAFMTPEEAHIRPILEAVTRGVRVVVLTRNGPPPQLPRHFLESPLVALIGDDFALSHGPEAGFHLPTVRKLLRNSCAWAVLTGAPEPIVYAAAPKAAEQYRRPVVLIETQERHEADWFDLASSLAPPPRAAGLLVTPRAAGHA